MAQCAQHVCFYYVFSHILNMFKYVLLLKQFVFKTEAHGFRTVHEELAKGMNSDLKSNELSAVKNILKVRQYSTSLPAIHTYTDCGSLIKMCNLPYDFLPCPVFLVLSGNHSEVHGPVPSRFRQAKSKLAPFA